MNKKTKIIFTPKHPRQINWAVVRTFCGDMVVGLDEGGYIRCISFAKGKHVRHILIKWQKAWPAAIFRANSAAAKKVAHTIMAVYFKNKNAALKCALFATPFQKKVWRELLKIPKGKTALYGEVADGIRNPKSARAVGLACGANPLPIIIPCHRVVASNGLGGFSSGICVKRKLLAQER